MPKYRQKVIESYYVVYEVEADSVEEAKGLIEARQGAEITREYRSRLLADDADPKPRRVVDGDIQIVDYVSEWDGSVTLITRALFDPKTKRVFDIEAVGVDGLEHLDREYIILPDGAELQIYPGEEVEAS